MYINSSVLEDTRLMWSRIAENPSKSESCCSIARFRFWTSLAEPDRSSNVTLPPWLLRTAQKVETISFVFWSLYFLFLISLKQVWIFLSFRNTHGKFILPGILIADLYVLTCCIVTINMHFRLQPISLTGNFPRKNMGISREKIREFTSWLKSMQLRREFNPD